MSLTFDEIAKVAKLRVLTIIELELVYLLKIK